VAARFAGLATAKRGFTLLELLLVCVIIIIVMGSVSASLAGFLARSRLRSSAARAASMGVFARSHALATGRRVVMEIDQAGGEIALLEQAPPRMGTGQAGEAYGGQAAGQPEEFVSLGERWRMFLPEGISISSLEIDGERVEQGRITFFPQGGAQAATIIFSLADASPSASLRTREEKEIRVNRITGRVKVE